jgi:hypothetical protein
MRIFRLIFLFLLTAWVVTLAAQRLELPAISLNKAEKELYVLINRYRMQKGLPSIPLSLNLTYVAKLHVQDLSVNHPYSKRCNLHSWSDKGPWSPCCYTEDHEEAQCMWNKPGELSNYPGFGYEIAYWTNEPLSPANFAKKALAGWQRSVPHNVVIVNLGRWRSKSWKAMGVGVYDGYAVVWFGEEEDGETLLINDYN